MGNGKWEMGEKKVHFHVDQLWRRNGPLAHLFFGSSLHVQKGHDGDDDDDAWWVHHHPIHPRTKLSERRRHEASSSY